MIRSSILLAATAAMSLAAAGGGAAAAPASGASNIVLVHGALVDGSGWRPVYDILKKDGYAVSIVQEPLTSLDEDVAATQRVLDQQVGPVVLVGQSYGGTVITVAGTDPKVKALVYVAAMQPDKGESSAELNATMPPASNNDLTASKDGKYYFFPPARFPALVAADVPSDRTQFMADSQMHMAAASFMAKLPAAAWRDKPSYAIVATDDKSINPQLQRFMSKRAGSEVTEVRASHAVFLSQPKLVAEVIERAARAVK